MRKRAPVVSPDTDRPRDNYSINYARNLNEQQTTHDPTTLMRWRIRRQMLYSDAGRFLLDIAHINNLMKHVLWWNNSQLVKQLRIPNLVDTSL